MMYSVKGMILGAFILVGLPTVSHSQIKFFGADTVAINYFTGKNLKNYPAKTKITGRIVDVTTGPSCGVLSGSGTLKIDIASSSKPYPKKYLYLVVPCFAGGDEYIGRKVALIVTALYEKGKPKPYNPIMNRLNSDGVPFYWLTEANRKNLYSQ